MNHPKPLPLKIKRGVKLAIEIAKLNSFSRFRFGCVALDKRGYVLSVGMNNEKTHPYQAKLSTKQGNPHAIYLHSEIATILKAREKVHTLIVVRLLRNGTPGYSKPCHICEEAIRLAKIKQTVYFDKNGEVVCHEYS